MGKQRRARQDRQRERIRRRRWQSESGLTYHVASAPDTLLELAPSLDDATAAAIVRDIRSDGGRLWLVPLEDGEVRCRILHPVGIDDGAVAFLQRHMRAIAKAVARLGPDEPPAENPFGDKPLPPGGRWDWLEAAEPN